METIIQKAIEGGWKNEHLVASHDYCDMLMDDLFWKSLGKILGWPEIICNLCQKKAIPPEKGENFWECDNCGILVEEGHEISSDVFYALRFHEINLTEGWDKAVSYLESLVVTSK